MAKRIFDILISLLLVVILSPVIIIIDLIIWLKMGRPILFGQIRPGLKERPFLLVKFRTMNLIYDEQGELLADEKRLTALGRFLRKYSLDELPQLINVLKGEMSLVGPRPLLMAYLERYSSEQARRHEVKPGITGWAQVNGRNALTWEEKFLLDIWYVENNSFILDLKILWLTLIGMIKAEGINNDGWATMPEFVGSESGISNDK